MPLLFWEQNQTVVDSLESCSIPRKLLLSDIFCNFVSIHWSFFFSSPETNVLSVDLPTKLALRRETGVLVILDASCQGCWGNILYFISGFTFQTQHSQQSHALKFSF